VRLHGYPGAHPAQPRRRVHRERHADHLEHADGGLHGLALLEDAGRDVDLAGLVLGDDVVEILEAAWNTQPVHHLNDTIARNFRLKGPILNLAGSNFDDWKAAIIAGSAATRKAVAPVLVCIDSFDGGTVIPVSWQNGYVDAARALGGTVETRDYPRDDHFSLPQSCIADARAWLTALLR
jgi:hypothetical protein